MAWRNEISPPENVRNTMDELFQAEIITKQQKEKMYEAEEVLLASDPHLEMNMRHHKVKERSKQMRSKKPIDKTEIIVEAKRLVSQEELLEKEIRYKNKAYDRELKQFKMDLAKSSQFEFESYPHYIIEKSRKRQQRPKSCNYADIRLIGNDKNILKLEIGQQDDIYFKDINTSKEGSDEMHNSRDLKNTVELFAGSIKVEGVNQARAIMTNKLPPVVQDKSVQIQTVDVKITKREPMTPKINTSDILTYYWKEWRNITISNKIHQKIEGENIERISRIDNFVSELTTEASKANTIKRRDTKFICPYLPQAKIKPKAISIKVEKMSTPSDQVSLEKIVIQQKNKLREQQKLINQLKLEQIKLATERSAQQAQIYLESSLQEVSLPMQRKLNYLKSTFPSILDRHYNKPKPNFLVQMEARQRERQKRKEELRKKTKLRIIEQQKLREEKERLKREELEEEKRIEHELKVQQLQEQARIRALEQLALKFCRLRRLKLGFGVFKKSLEIREIYFLVAEQHHNTRILEKSFCVWRLANQSAVEKHLNSARDHYQMNLLRNLWNAWRQLGVEVKRDRQVADDFQQLILEARVFRTWRGFTQVRFQALCQELDQARLFYERRVLARCLNAWRRLREASDVERRAERKKEALRNSVRLVLPDFNPSRALSLFPSSTESNFSAHSNNFSTTPTFELFASK